MEPACHCEMFHLIQDCNTARNRGFSIQVPGGETEMWTKGDSESFI